MTITFSVKAEINKLPECVHKDIDLSIHRISSKWLIHFILFHSFYLLMLIAQNEDGWQLLYGSFCIRFFWIQSDILLPTPLLSQVDKYMCMSTFQVCLFTCRQIWCIDMAPNEWVRIRLFNGELLKSNVSSVKDWFE